MSNYKTLPDTGFVRLASIIAPSGPIPVIRNYPRLLQVLYLF